MPYRIRVLCGGLELEIPDRDIEPPRAPAQLGVLILMALSPGREIPLETFKLKLYDCDPAHVSNAAIQTPIARLRQVGLPIPLRRYVLEVEPSEVDLVDADTRMKGFIEAAMDADRLGSQDTADLIKTGLELHHLWQVDPAAAVGNNVQLSALFETYRRRHRRFGATFVRLLAKSGERERARDMFHHYVDWYGEDSSWSELETEMWPVSSEPLGEAPAQLAPPGPPAQTSAFHEVGEMLSASVHRPWGELVLSSHNLDLIYSVDRVVEADDQVRIGTPVESPGGAGANTAVGLARLGVPVGVAGIVARDREGIMLRRDFIQEDIDYSNLLMVRSGAGVGRTGHAYIFTDRVGRRATYIHPGINQQWAPEVHDRDGVDDLVKAASNARIVHFSSFYGHAERELQQMVLAGLPEDTVVSFDPGTLYSAMGLDRLKPFILRCNVLQVYEHQLRALVDNSSADPDIGRDDPTSRADLQALMRWRHDRGGRGPLVVLVKTHRAPGDDSAETYGFDTMTLAAGRDGVEDRVSPQAPRWRAPVLLDSTGAGDAMATGLHYGLLSGASPADCVDVAYVIAMSTSSEFGCRAGLVREAALPDAWEQHLPAADLPGWLGSSGRGQPVAGR